MYGIFTYVYIKNQLNVGKYTSPMDPMKHDEIPYPTIKDLISKGHPTGGQLQHDVTEPFFLRSPLALRFIPSQNTGKPKDQL